MNVLEEIMMKIFQSGMVKVRSVAVSIADIIFVMSIHNIVKDPERNEKLSKIAMIIALAAFVIGGITAPTAIPP